MTSYLDTHTWKKGNISYFLSVRVIPVRMALIQKNTNKKCWQGYREKGTLKYCWLECKLVQPLWKPVWRFLTEPKIVFSNSTLGHISKNKKTQIHKDKHTPVFIETLFTVAKTLKQPKCPSTDQQIKKLWYRYTIKYYSAI